MSASSTKDIAYAVSLFGIDFFESKTEHVSEEKRSTSSEDIDSDATDNREPPMVSKKTLGKAKRSDDVPVYTKIQWDWMKERQYKRGLRMGREKVLEVLDKEESNTKRLTHQEIRVALDDLRSRFSLGNVEPNLKSTIADVKRIYDGRFRDRQNNILNIGRGFVFLKAPLRFFISILSMLSHPRRFGGLLSNLLRNWGSLSILMPSSSNTY